MPGTGVQQLAGIGEPRVLVVQTFRLARLGRQLIELLELEFEKFETRVSILPGADNRLDLPVCLSPVRSGLFRNVLAPFLSLSLLMRPQGLLLKTPTFQIGEDLFLKYRRVVLLKPYDHRSIKANTFLQRQTAVDAKPARGMREVFAGNHIGFEARSVEALIVEEIGAFAWVITGRKRPGSLMPVVISLTSGYSLTHPSGGPTSGVHRPLLF